MSFSRPAVGATVVALALLLRAGTPGAAQVVQGKVLDAASDQAIPIARVSLMDSLGAYVETVLTDGEGNFRVQAREEGYHVLEADRLGYAVQRTDSFKVAQEVLQRDVLLDPDPVQVEGVTVEVYSYRLLGDATLSGVYARRARSPSVGSNRVLVRGDPWFDSAHQVRDLLPLWLPRPRCRSGRPFVCLDGQRRQIGPLGPVLETSIAYVEAVEFYSDLTSAPMAIRPGEDAASVSAAQVRRCGVVAVWTKAAPR